MAEGEAQWELCKENIQPLRSGRAVSALHQALSQQDGSGSTAIQQQKQAFESELRLYNGDDPLDVWDRYIRWTQQTFPQGGKESNLSVLLERAVKRFVEDDRYYNDSRYVSLWIKLAENSTEPLDIYNYMHGQGIGVRQAALYIAWAEELEEQGNSKKADSVYQDGLRCGAEPTDRLQQFHRGFQARVSRQVMEGMMGGEQEADSPEPAQPQRSTLVDLKHRGKKTAIAPIVRTGAAASHRSRGLNLQLPAAPQNNQHGRVLVFDENQPSAPEPSEPRLEPWMAPPTSKEKENELMPEKWTNVRMPQKSRFGHGVAAPPSRPNFHPFVEESDQPPVVTPCKINPAVNTVLSARKPSKEETALERLQEPQPVEGQGKEQSMYCKELLFSGATEFCFEELRAERYNKRVAQELEEMAEVLKMEKEKLRRRLEEKLQVCPSVTGTSSQLTDQPSGPEVPTALASMTGLKVYDESDADSPAGFDQPLQNEVFKSADSGEGLKVTSFSIFNENGAAGNVQETSSVPGPSRSSARRPLATLLKPPAEPLASGPETVTPAVDPLNDDAILDSYQNKTLYPSPDDTCDFVRAARLASTPFSSGQYSEVPTQTPAANLMDYEAPRIVNPLSPIEEASQEDGHRSTSLSGSSCVRASVMGTCHFELSQSSPEHITQDSVTDVEVEDPCSLCSRQRALDKVDLYSLPGFHRVPGPLPEVEELAVFTGEEDAVGILSPITTGKSYRVHFGQTKREEKMIVKVDYEAMPWDFYITSQMKTRLSADSLKYFGAQSSCFVYTDGCVTLTRGNYECSLQDILDRPTHPHAVACLTLELLEMVYQMHSCHLVHGGICPEVLLLRSSVSRGDGDAMLRFLHFSRCVDLDMQPEVVSVACLPLAQDLIRQGLLSPSSSPYQVDLVGVAETVYAMLKKGPMNPVKDDSQWKPADGFEAAATHHEGVWQEFFRKILNPDGQSTAAVLSELQKLIKDHFGQRLSELDCCRMIDLFLFCL